ncbi:MAG: hypothetical protein PVF70_11180 [Anaerolineales bacterium]
MSDLSYCGDSHASGDWYIHIETGLCNGGGDCVSDFLLETCDRSVAPHTRRMETEVVS